MKELKKISPNEIYANFWSNESKKVSLGATCYTKINSALDKCEINLSEEFIYPLEKLNKCPDYSACLVQPLSLYDFRCLIASITKIITNGNSKIKRKQKFTSLINMYI